MTKKQIISKATELGFKLDYDKSKGIGHDGKKSTNGKWMRFVSVDKELDEKDLRWIWWMDKSDSDNIENGKYIQNRLQKKAKIQEFLKY